MHNTKELRCGRALPNFPKMVELLRGMLERFLNTLHCLDVCFIADDTLEKLPRASRVGKTTVAAWISTAQNARAGAGRDRVGGLAQGVHSIRGGPQVAAAERSHGIGPRHAAYDLKKLRGKSLVEKIGSSHRYQPTRKGLRAMTALVILRDKVIQPLLANSCQLKRDPKPKNATTLDKHYQRLQAGIQGLFAEIGIAA